MDDRARLYLAETHVGDISPDRAVTATIAGNRQIGAVDFGYGGDIFNWSPNFGGQFLHVVGRVDSRGNVYRYNGEEYSLVGHVTAGIAYSGGGRVGYVRAQDWTMGATGITDEHRAAGALILLFHLELWKP